MRETDFLDKCAGTMGPAGYLNFPSPDLESFHEKMGEGFRRGAVSREGRGDPVLGADQRRHRGISRGAIGRRVRGRGLHEAIRATKRRLGLKNQPESNLFWAGYGDRVWQVHLNLAFLSEVPRIASHFFKKHVIICFGRRGRIGNRKS